MLQRRFLALPGFIAMADWRLPGAAGPVNIVPGTLEMETDSVLLGFFARALRVRCCPVLTVHCVRAAL